MLCLLGSTIMKPSAPWSRLAAAAHAEHKPIFATFANEQLAEHFYFIKQLATVAVITPDVMAAWKLFTRWQA